MSNPVTEFYQALIARADQTLAERGDAGKTVIQIGSATCEHAAGSLDVMDEFLKHIQSSGREDIAIHKTGCTGRCSKEPIVGVLTPGKPPVKYERVNREVVHKIFTNHIQKGILLPEHALDGSLEEEYQYELIFCEGRRCGRLANLRTYFESKAKEAGIGRGVVKDILNRLPEAVRDLENATRIAPENPDSWYYYANSLARSERYPDALRSYEKLNTIEPQSLEGWMDHADLLLKLKGPEAALKKFSEGELVHKLNARYKYRLASYLLRCGREQQALLTIEEALMADHTCHNTLLEHYPEVTNMPQVMHLLDLYKK